MRTTLFHRPLQAMPFKILFRLGLLATGWRIEGELPPEKKMILIGAPHTSNWDFVLMLATAFKKDMKLYWMVKDNVYKAGWGWLADWAGGIPIDREHPQGLVGQMVQEFRQADEMMLVNTPEATRAKRDRWKTGFWHIAKGAQVPLLLCFVHAPTKTVGIGELLWPSDDLEADFRKIAAFYSDKKGINPELYTPPLGDEG